MPLMNMGETGASAVVGLNSQGLTTEEYGSETFRSGRHALQPIIGNT